MNLSQDLVSDNESIFSKIGKGIHPIEAECINQALKYHNKLHGLNFTYFGKIFNQKNDYQIIFTQFEILRDELGKITNPEYMEEMP